jgi:uncharacterized membrane protein
VTRQEFLATLERGLTRLPAAQRAEILADYQSYFAEGAGVGRDEHSVAHSLGNPARLAAELRLGLEAPGSAFHGFTALLAIALLDGLRWFPLVLGLLLILLLLGIGAVALGYAAFTLLVLPFDQPLGGIGAVLLRGLALLAAGVAAFSVARAGVLLLVKFFVRLHRRNTRLLRPTPEVST